MNIKILYSQLRPSMAFKMLCFTAFSRILNPQGNIFFSINAEDQVIDTLLGHPKMGYYVDVGCNQPIRFSNTFAFYMKGWKGLTIDANSSLIALHKKIRSKDISICCAVSDSVRTVDFTKFSDDSLSSISGEFINECKNMVPIISVEKMETRTLNSIFLEQNIPEVFDFLSIDVEGHDFEVLKSVNLIDYKPRLIVIEMRDFSFENLQANHIYIHLTKYGYKLAAYSIINGYFLRNELI